MRASAYRAVHDTRHDYAHYEGDAEADFGMSDGLIAGERIGALPRRRRGRAVVRWSCLLSLLGLGGWAWSTDRLPPFAELEALFTALTTAPAQSPSSATTPELQTASLLPPVAAPVTETPPEAAPTSGAAALTPTPVPGEAQAVISSAAPASGSGDNATSAPEAGGKSEEELAAEAVAAAAGPPEPLPPPVVDPKNPYQKKAIAAGLHPDLSLTVLKRLSAEDYKTAAAAIRTALAETPADESFVGPKVRKPGRPQFQVRFVKGAPAACRRYVVAVSFDGWATTALPMEKCGIKTPQPRRRDEAKAGAKAAPGKTTPGSTRSSVAPSRPAATVNRNTPGPRVLVGSAP